MIAMSDHYDRLETRTPSSRESALFVGLRHVLTVSKPRAHGLRAQLKGIEIASLSSRAALGKIPIIRRESLLALQAEAAPLGGLVSTRIGSLGKLFLGPGGLVSPEGHAKDWWGVGRALFAAGLRKGTMVLNCFGYDLIADGHMMESGAAAIGCPVISAGHAPLDRKIEAITRLRPAFFCGTAEHLKALLDRGTDLGADLSCLRNALVTDAAAPGLRSELSLRGLSVKRAFLLPELGLIAYESDQSMDMCVAEGLILEIVTPGNQVPAAPGVEGEIVVSRINADYPLLRYATGTLSTILSQGSSCGRTAIRIRAPRDRAPDSALCSGMRIHASHVAEIKRQHPDIGRMRLVIGRRREKDALRLRVEHRGDATIIGERLTETLHRVTKVRGTVELVEPGSMSDDDAMIIDERPLN